ncbi:MAG: YegP family protein [Xanthomonadales bacterium]|nr:YegP family protein [Xanthomonadales bacterium]
MAGKYRLYTGNNGKFYFQLKAANGQVILQSQGYASKSSANNGIQSVQKNCGSDDRYERKVAKDGQHYFVLKASNGQVIGSSEMYKQQKSCENGVESVKKNGPTDKVDDDTA